MAYLRDRRAFGNIGTRKFRGARFGDALSPRFSGLLDQYVGAAAAYSLRTLAASWLNKDVVEVRRASDNTSEGFTEKEITNGTLVDWVNEEIELPLDTASGAAAAYSLRNLSSSYTGSVVDVRRSSDDAEDSFTAAEVADGTLTTWVGAGNDGFVTQWYDQSGNANHATQGTPASQPKIVSGGSLVTGGLDFDGVDDIMATSVAINAAQLATSFSVSRPDDTLANKYIWTIGATLGIIDFIDGSENAAIAAGTAFINGAMSTANQSVKYSLFNQASSELAINGATITSGDVGTRSGNAVLQLGGRAGADFMDGTIEEIILYNSDQSDKRRAIEENIGSTYGITLTSSKNGTVSKWYDQSTTSGVPNANHAVQTDAAKQPKIVDAGVYLGEVDFLNGTSTFLETNNSNLCNVAELSVFSVLKPHLERSQVVAFSCGSVVGGSTGYGGWRLNLNGYLNKAQFQTQTIGNASMTSLDKVVDENDTLVSYVANFPDAAIFTNGQAGGSASSAISPNNNIAFKRRFRIGCQYTYQVAGFYTKPIKEIILYTSDQTDNRTALEANIGETYGIAGIPAYDNTVNGFVETWYDQSGNGNNATQLTAGSQPKIVSGGSLVTGGLDFDGTNDVLETSLVPPNIATLIGVANWDIINVTGMIIGARDSINQRSYLSQISGGFTAVGVSDSAFAGPRVVAGDDYLLYGSYSGSTRSLSTNGVLLTDELGTVPNNTTQGYSIGAFNNIGTSSGFMNGTIQEVIVYASDQTANRLAIEANINNQYDIY